MVGELEARLPRDLQRVWADKGDMLGPFHDGTRQFHRVLRPEDTGDRPRAPVGAIHHGGVHLLHAHGGIDRPAPCVEQRLVFERADRGHHRVHRAATVAQHRFTGFQRPGEAIVIGGLLFGRHVFLEDGSCATVNGKGIGHVCPFNPACSAQ